MDREEFESLLDEFASLQARVRAHSLVLDALIISHPDQAALTEAWNRVSAGKISSDSTKVALGTQAKAHEYSLEEYQRWKKRIEASRPRPSAPG